VSSKEVTGDGNVVRKGLALTSVADEVGRRIGRPVRKDHPLILES